MPPPPTKRIKRPPVVLGEDEYTDGLSSIITRDFFPGLAETRAQQEYLNALEANNPAWIAEAGQNLRQAMTPGPRQRRSTRNSRFSTPSATPLRAADTPVGLVGGDTPCSVAGSEVSTTNTKPEIDTSSLSLDAFQSKYTSEDNESFNVLLDKQNARRREKHAYLWVGENKIPSARQIAHRTREQNLLANKLAAETAAGRELAPISVGATDSRPAKPDAWKLTNGPANTFMFPASSVDEQGLQTVVETRENASKMGPKSTVYANTRFRLAALGEDVGSVPPSPSLDTSIIDRRDAARAARSETEYSGGETPRVNGYAYVDEDEAEDIPAPEEVLGPSYRDLLAGQGGDGTPNPFKLSEMRSREDLHHRLVERDAAKNRVKQAQSVKGLPVPGTPGGRGHLTPAGRKLLDKMGRTPVSRRRIKEERATPARDMWTPKTSSRRVGVLGNK